MVGILLMTDQINDFGQSVNRSHAGRRKRGRRSRAVADDGLYLPGRDATAPEPMNTPSRPAGSPLPAHGSLREHKKSQSRQAILRAAAGLFDERGYEEARMRDIAARATVSYQTVYNYFPTKGHLLRALLLERAALPAGALRQVVKQYAGAGDLPDADRDLAGAIDILHAITVNAIGATDRALWRFAAMEAAADADGRLDSLLDPQAREQLGQLLLEARKAGDLVADVNLGQLTDTLFDLWEYAVLRFVLDPEASADATLRRLHIQAALVLEPYLSSARGR
jgi:AcrR family transcriptional regulator